MTMPTILFVPTSHNVDLSYVAKIIATAFENANVKSYICDTANDITHDITAYIAGHKTDEFLEDIVQYLRQQSPLGDVALVQGLPLCTNTPYAYELNQKIARAIGAMTVIVASKNCIVHNHLQATANGYPPKRLLGVFITDSDEQIHSPLPIIGAGDMNIGAWVSEFLKNNIDIPLSPAMLKYQIVASAKSKIMRIVLPEGSEPRTLQAVKICAERGMAHCVLLGDTTVIKNAAKDNDIDINHPNITIVDANVVKSDYVTRLVALRGHKGVDAITALQQLEDTVVLGTMMLEMGQVDGLVSGAVNTTANTIRPPLQIIKTQKNSSIVSSVFFMCLPEQVLVYGDCAINPNPTAEQLAEIAIQSADSAKTFGINPKVAMISYSTGDSGSGTEVTKVRLATELIKARRPDILVDGPLQYDAAIMEDVAKSKAPNSPVAGHANVFIFPDLTTGNTVYKAVQRSADCISIGPMLQGIRKPVNDLSRGALVEDIVYTIALTAIQAQNQK